MKRQTWMYALLIFFVAAISVLPSDTINMSLSIHEGTNMAAALSPMERRDEGKYYWAYTKDPSIQAFTDLMNRALGGLL